MLIQLHARAALKVCGLPSYMSFLEYFPIKTNALLPCNNVHSQDFSVITFTYPLRIQGPGRCL